MIADYLLADQELGAYQLASACHTRQMAKRRIKQLVQFDTCILTPTVGKAETNEVGISPCLYLDAPCIRATHGFNYQVLEEEEQKSLVAFRFHLDFGRKYRAFNSRSVLAELLAHHLINFIEQCTDTNIRTTERYFV